MAMKAYHLTCMMTVDFRGNMERLAPAVDYGYQSRPHWISVVVR